MFRKFRSDTPLVSQELENLDTIPSRKKQWALTRESFDGLLAWLDPNREEAGKKYEEIRSKLVRGFASHGCADSEELADETINRVARRLPEIGETYVGDRMRYFYRVAHYVHLEYLKRPSSVTMLETEQLAAHDKTEDVESEYECLEQCLKRLTARSRELVLQYYQGERSVKIKIRKALAERFNTTTSNLRLQAHRIRATMKKCILKCLEERAA
ncbi:MAG: sigma-70 family RNA polymerase sigma factor [Acidobacteria bacterium]|nr:sigma-70 family RNA polymerase sigma factor [Acidobacteriota bacterium]